MWGSMGQLMMCTALTYLTTPLHARVESQNLYVMRSWPTQNMILSRHAFPNVSFLHTDMCRPFSVHAVTSTAVCGICRKVHRLAGLVHPGNEEHPWLNGSAILGNKGRTVSREFDYANMTPLQSHRPRQHGAALSGILCNVGMHLDAK